MWPFKFLSNNFVWIVVAVCDPVHDLETIFRPCLLPTDSFMSFFYVASGNRV